MQTQPLPSSEPKKKKSNWWKWLLGGFFGLYVLGQIASSDDGRTKKAELADTESAITSDSAGVSATTSTPEPAPAENWQYSKFEDKMGSATSTASVVANEELQFEFPYNGGASATFTIRKKAGTTDIALRVSKGQFNSTFDGGRCRFKFDGNVPVAYSFVGASDHSSDVIFFNSEQAIIKKLKKAKKMVIEAEFYNEGTRQIEFDVANLKW